MARETEHRSLILTVFFLYFISTAKTSNELQKRYIGDTDAICNDNTKATFYIGPKSKQKWIVYFESGGFCASLDDCNKRYLNQNSTMFMTSNGLPDKVTGKDLLSASKDENPTFSDYTRVLVPYCSSDLWLGLKTNPKKPFHFVDDSSEDNFSFRGQTIFRSVFQDLLQQYNLSEAKEIILAGSSAGAIGVLNHANWVLNRVIKSHGLKATLFTVVDSGWFIDFQGSLRTQVNPEFLSFANISLRACMDFSSGHTCCPSALCMISRGYYPASVPLLVVSSMFDSFMLRSVFERLQEEGKTAEDNYGDFLSAVNMYGGEVNGSITSTENKAYNVSFFVPACFQHVYLVTSSLWEEDGILPPSFEISVGSAIFRNKVKSGTWKSTQIVTGVNSTSIRDFIATWKKSPGTPVRLTDSCIGAQCNHACPRQLLFTDPAVNWGEIVHTIIIVLSLVVTVTCVGVKSIFMLYQYYLTGKQKQYLNDPDTSFTQRELPLCPTNEMISIACLSLSYSVVASKKKSKDDEGHPVSKDKVSFTTEESVAPSHSRRTYSSLIAEVITEEDSNSSDSSTVETFNQEKRILTKSLSNDSVFPPSQEEPRERKRKCGKVHFIDMDNHRKPESEKYSDQPKESLRIKHHIKDKKPKHKQILKKVSVYFNTGELVAIMGPSGCGKTTLLDLLTGRRKQENHQGQVYINGIALNADIHDWYARKTGYVLQLAVPYYEELTVRQNLFFAAHMRLPKSMSHIEKFERVEQILAETGLMSVADVVVGGSVGQGLSGGQKRRLCIAFQMINLPAVLFLDEPTSGLDASSSLELLNHLNLVAASGRLVILTIHQPRLEIFHLFHKIILLYDGQVAYYGDPAVAPSIFLKAYFQSTTKEYRRREDAPNIDTTNPADTVMDLLGNSHARRAILDYYQASGEPQAVQEAIKVSERQAKNAFTFERMKREKTGENDAGPFNRIFVLEGRTSKRQTIGQITYFPLIFFTFGFLVGTVYWQAQEKDGLLLMSAYCINTVSSPLFLSAILMAHLNKALSILNLERADRCGRPLENVIQTFVRTASLCVIPVIVCSVMTYFMVMTSYDLWEFLLVTIISLVLNQTWISVYMMVICAHPGIAHRICPMVSAAGGFAGGFIIPKPVMPPGYNLLFYVNPVFYGFSAIMKVLLQDVQLTCKNDSILNCISTDGNAVLTRFGFHTVNVYENLLIMLGMTVLSLIVSWLFLEMKYISVNVFTKKLLTSLREDEALEVPMEPLEKQPSAVWPGDKSSRRKSTLGLITGDEGLHIIKGPEYGSVSTPEQQDAEHNEQSKLSRKRSSRKDRWVSVRKRMTERKESAELQMKQINALHRELQLQENQTKRKDSLVRSSSAPVAVENSPRTRKHHFSCGDTVLEGEDLKLTVLIPKTKREDIAKGNQDTTF